VESEVKILWLYRYPGDDYLTSLFSQVVIIIEELTEDAKQQIDFINDEIKEKML
jgi:hypothetical protein